MRVSRGRRNVALAFVGTGIVAALVFVASPDDAGTTLNAILICYALAATLFGMIVAVKQHREVRARVGLASGQNIMARWQVDVDTWRDFLALNTELQAASPGRANALTMPLEPPTNGIAIVVGEAAIDVGGQLFVLPRRGVPEITHAQLHESRVRPTYIELHLKYPGVGLSATGMPLPSSHSVLRFPVPSSGVVKARSVAAHYNGDTAGTADFFHGTGDGTDHEDLSRCWSCGFETHKYRTQCPQCGSKLQSRRWSRRFGFLLTLCGVFLTGLMGAVLYFVGPMLKHPGEEVNGTSFSGSATQALLVLLVLGVVFAFGATALGYGAWQMATGRRNKKVLYVMLGLVGALLVATVLL